MTGGSTRQQFRETFGWSVAGRWQLKYFVCSPRTLGKMNPFLTILCFKWVAQPPSRLLCWHPFFLATKKKVWLGGPTLHPGFHKWRFKVGIPESWGPGGGRPRIPRYDCCEWRISFHFLGSMQTWEIFSRSTFATFETFWKVWTSYLLWCTSPPWFQVLETGGKDPVPTCEPRRSPQIHLWWNSPETVNTISMVQNSWYTFIIC